VHLTLELEGVVVAYATVLACSLVVV
jgi:hypothetical protein